VVALGKAQPIDPEKRRSDQNPGGTRNSCPDDRDVSNASQVSNSSLVSNSLHVGPVDLAPETLRRDLISKTGKNSNQPTAVQASRSESVVEIAQRSPATVTSHILEKFCAGPGHDVAITVNGIRFLTIRVENLSRMPGHGLVYRVLVEPGREGKVKSWTGDSDAGAQVVDVRRLPSTGSERIVGSVSRHQIGDDLVVVLPHLGRIELARAQLRAGADNPFEQVLLRDCAHASRGSLLSDSGECACSLSLGTKQGLNEDAVLVCGLPGDPTKGPSLLGVVADGMGGYLGAQAAAGCVVGTFATADFTQATLLEVAQRLPTELKRLWDELRERPEPGVGSLISDRMGAPFAAVRIFDSSCQVLRVGDCRAALYRFASEGYRCQWSSDDQAYGHTVWNSVRLDGGEPSEVVLEVEEHMLQNGDYLVVATDGVWASLSTDEVRAIISRECGPSEVERGIIDAVTRAEWHRGYADNRGLIVYRHS
jgi:serine/threonine protein phosphatase PrpC